MSDAGILKLQEIQQLAADRGVVKVRYVEEKDTGKRYVQAAFSDGTFASVRASLYKTSAKKLADLLTSADRA